MTTEELIEALLMIGVVWGCVLVGWCAP